MTTTTTGQHGPVGFVPAAFSSTSRCATVAAGAPSGDRYRDEHAPTRVDRP